MLQINYEPKLSELTTIRLGGKAIAEINIHDNFDENELSTEIKKLGGDVFVLGAGSNLLVSDSDVPLVLLRTKFSHNIEVLEKDDTKTLIKVGSNVRLPRLVGRCASLGLEGLEGLCGIPGSVGGAIAMNAGSYGAQICDHLHSLLIYSPQIGIAHIDAKDINYEYRKFSVKKINTWFFVIYATFMLTHAKINVIKNKMFLNFFKKKSTQPVKAWSAGCLFKNPSPDSSAGMLLDKCGFKGKSKGGMQFSSLHANFLINQGQGSASAAFDLMAEAKEAVLSQFGLTLTPEVKILCP